MSCQVLKRPCWKRYEIEISGQGLLLLIVRSWWPHCKALLFWILKVSWCWIVDRIKFLKKMARSQNIKIKRTLLCGLVIFIKNFDPINIKRSWGPEIIVLFSEVSMTKTFCSIKSRRHWSPNLISYFFQRHFSKASDTNSI